MIFCISFSNKKALRTHIKRERIRKQNDLSDRVSLCARLFSKFHHHNHHISHIHTRKRNLWPIKLSGLSSHFSIGRRLTLLAAFQPCIYLDQIVTGNQVFLDVFFWCFFFFFYEKGYTVVMRFKLMINVERGKRKRQMLVRHFFGGKLRCVIHRYPP